MVTATDSSTAASLLNKTTTATSTSKSTKTDSDLSGLATDYESFLNLFLTQLKNQDPTEPLDTNQMTDQIVQFSQVEQQINTNKKLDSMATASNNLALTNSLAYVDKFVEWEGSQMNFNGTGSEFAYKLDKAADTVKITITDSAGKVIRSVDNLDGTAGKKNTAVWDGTDDSGNKVAVGVYNVKVTATSAGEDVTSKTYVTDYVTEVDLEDGDIKLHFGDLSISSSKVLSIKSSALYNSGGDGTDTGTDTGTETETETETPPVVNQEAPTPTPSPSA